MNPETTSEKTVSELKIMVLNALDLFLFMDKHLDQIEVSDRESFIEFWEVYVDDFKARDLSWSGQCMYGFLDLFPHSIYETVEKSLESPATLSWEYLADIFKKFRLLQMET